MKNLIHPKPFYFIRHGESRWNVEGKFAGGRVDTPLTNLGKQQAKDAIQIFENLSPTPTHIINSSLSRARDTALILNHKNNIPMIGIDDLREIDAGEWEGRHSLDALDDWANGQKPENGEDLDMFACRLQKAFNLILSNNDYGIPFISAHGRIINGLDHLYGFKPRQLQIKNCQILKFIPNIGSPYPWDVYTLSIKSGQIQEELAAWSQI